MKNICVFLLVIFFISFQFQGFGQNDKPDEKGILKVAKEIMNSAGTCALISVDTEGRSRVRTMDPFAPEEDLTVWFGTNSKSRKVDQIKNDSRVTLYYLDKDQSGYVMIHGTAELVSDKKAKQKYWKKKWEAFYTKNKENYLLIKVSPQWVEVSSAPRGLSGDAKTWQPATVVLDSTINFK